MAGEFAGRVEAQQAQGYRLAFLEDEGAVVAVAGFRVMDMLATGRTLYVDDLVTDEAWRSRAGTGRRCWTGYRPTRAMPDARP